MENNFEKIQNEEGVLAIKIIKEEIVLASDIQTKINVLREQKKKILLQLDEINNEISKQENYLK